MTKPVALVLIPHVSWRRLSLLELLDALSRQTKACRVIVLHDDPDEACGEHENVRLDQTTQRFLHRPPWWPNNLLGGVTPTSKERAQCERWKLVEEIAARDSSENGIPILTLDDDLIVWETYVVDMVARLKYTAMHGDLDPVVSWGGVDFDYRWRHYYDEHGACELLLPQAGVMAFYADTFVGLGSTILAERGHVRGGCEEVPVAAFLQERGVPIFRPSGTGPRPHKLAYDPRSAFRTTQNSMRTLLDYCIRSGDWPHAKAIQQLLIGKRPVTWTATPVTTTTLTDDTEACCYGMLVAGNQHSDDCSAAKHAAVVEKR